MNFKGKVVLVTGASKGIGKATALLFAENGATIVINYNKSKDEAVLTLKEISKITNALIIKCDVSKEKQVENMFNTIIKKFGRLDILVNNAGIYIDGDEWNGNSEIWEKTLKQNLISVMNTSKFAAKILQKQKSGLIINVASKMSISGKFDSIAYAASKAGVVSVTQAYSKLLTPFGNAIAISPGATNAGYWLRAPKDELKERISRSKLNRLLTTKEVAEKILFLTSNQTKYNGKNVLLEN